jgi:putative methionine-R-sulfoxide reductase with GAF domain
MTPAQKEILQELQTFAQTAPTVQSLMEQMAKRLHEKMTRYNWTGFYLVDPADAGYLIVGPYAGSFTPNTRFPITRGLCGAAASGGQVVVVQDVSTDPRYLAGSSMVKSEIVEQETRSRARYRKLFCGHIHQTGAGVCRGLRGRHLQLLGKRIVT